MHQGYNVVGMCMWGINLRANNKVTYTVDQFIHMMLFLLFNI